MKTVEDLQAKLAEAFMDLKAGKIEPKTMESLSNAAGKIMAPFKYQLAYAEARGHEPNIPFLSASLGKRKGAPTSAKVSAKKPAKPRGLSPERPS